MDIDEEGWTWLHRCRHGCWGTSAAGRFDEDISGWERQGVVREAAGTGGSEDGPRDAQGRDAIALRGVLEEEHPVVAAGGERYGARVTHSTGSLRVPVGDAG